MGVFRPSLLMYLTIVIDVTSLVSNPANKMKLPTLSGVQWTATSLSHELHRIAQPDITTANKKNLAILVIQRILLCNISTVQRCILIYSHCWCCNNNENTPTTPARVPTR